MGILVSWEAATVLVAVIATLVSLCTFVQQREQNKLSVAPFLDVSFEAGPRALKVNILNNGNGPLIVAGDAADATAILIPKLEEVGHNDGPDDQGFVDNFLAQWIDDGALDN